MKLSGISLLELMITLVIIGILASIALPTYQLHRRAVWRTEAPILLLEASLQLEDYHVTHHTYSGVAPQSLPGFVFSQAAHYQLMIEKADDNRYQLQAVPLFDDDLCGIFSLTSEGEKQVSQGLNLAACWP